MRLAIMQPYFMPYLGYFQLIAAVDRFVVYDDVNFIKGGWINRNNILLNGKPHLITIPLADASPFKKINETGVSYKIDWQSKLLKTLEAAYKKAPFYTDIIAMLEPLLSRKADSIAALNRDAILSVIEYAGLQTKIIHSSEVYQNNDLKAAERVIDICNKEQATVYVNAAGGSELYATEQFNAAGLDLKFINMEPVYYDQLGKDFVSNLSMIDVLMFNDKAAIKNLLDQYRLS